MISPIVSSRPTCVHTRRMFRPQSQSPPCHRECDPTHLRARRRCSSSCPASQRWSSRLATSPCQDCWRVNARSVSQVGGIICFASELGSIEPTKSHETPTRRLGGRTTSRIFGAIERARWRRRSSRARVTPHTKFEVIHLSVNRARSSFHRPSSRRDSTLTSLSLYPILP